MTNDELLCSIASVLAVDGKMSRHEKQFFAEVCERLAISREQHDAVMTKIRQGKGSVHLPEDEADKKRLLYFLVQAVVADGVVAPEERHVLDAVVKRLGIDQAYVEQFIEGRLKEIQQEQYTRSQRPTIACPKCGHEQPESHQCRRCGIIFEKFKKAQTPSDVDKLRELFASANT